DEQVQMTMYQLRFDQWGLPVDLELAKNGFEALMKISAGAPDVLITDLSLPGMDGNQMIETLVSSYNIQDMKIFVVTSLTKDDIADRGGLPDSVTVFYKPVPFHMLESMIRDMVTAMNNGESF
ncbi:MAG: response regulator, partial [Gammaproteobacteria bacterium]|nr:response regulator [Gammaproteobacteria bacterium]